MLEFQKLINSLALEQKDAANQGDRQTALVLQRLINAIDRVVVQQKLSLEDQK